jgi:hypothetical protein
MVAVSSSRWLSSRFPRARRVSCQGRFLSSDIIRREKAALLRALELDKKKKAVKKDPPSKAARRTSFANDKDSSKSKPRREKLTMDEFFANLDKSNVVEPIPPRGRSSEMKNSNRRDSQESSSIQPINRFGNGGISAPRADMRSFFDEVNAIMEKKRALDNPKDSATSLNSGLSSIVSMGNNDVASGDSSVTSSPSQRIGRRPSILDMLPPPAKERGPDAYEEEAFDQYSELLDTTIESPKFLRQHTKKPLEGPEAESVIAWLRAEEPVVTSHLPQLQRALEGRLELDVIKGEKSMKDSDLRTDLAEQEAKFMDQLGWTKQQYSVAVGALASMGVMCAKRATAPPLEIAWQKLKEAGYKMNKDVLHNYLYVSSTFSLKSPRMLPPIRSGGSILDFLDGLGSSGKKDNTAATLQPAEENRNEVDGIDVSMEVALCHDMLFEPTEQSTSIRVRMLVSQGKAKEAEQLLDSSMVGEHEQISS